MKKDFELREALFPVFEIMRIQAQFKNLKLIVKIDKDVPRMVSGDNKRLCQILFSLLGNSVKYTEEGCISVSVSVLSGNSLEFMVQDTGKGMSREEQLALFKLFGKASSASFTNTAVGLGLTFCKSVIEEMQGSIRCLSNPGQGTKMTFNIGV